MKQVPSFLNEDSVPALEEKMREQMIQHFLLHFQQISHLIFHQILRNCSNGSNENCVHTVCQRYLQKQKMKGSGSVLVFQI